MSLLIPLSSLAPGDRTTLFAFFAPLSHGILSPNPQHLTLNPKPRCEPATMMDAIEFCTPILLRNGHDVEILPMLSLYQYLAKEVVKDAIAFANACVLKARACAAAGFVSEAMDLLGDVFAGRGLPDVVPMDRPPKGQEGLPPKKEVYFDQAQPASHESNQAAVAKLVGSRLPVELEAQYPASLRHLLALTKGEVLLRLVDSSPEWPHPDPALAAVCEEAETTFQTLRDAIFQAGKVEAPDTPANAEEGAEAPGVPKQNYTRLALGVMAQCDLVLSHMVERRGLLADALAKVSELAAVLADSGDAVSPEGAAEAQGEKGGDARQHTHAHLWLQCRVAATRILLAQGRYGRARQLAGAAQQEAASLNEQVLSREISLRLIQLDMHEGRTDLSLAALQELVSKGRKLDQRDGRLACIVASFAELQRDHGMEQGALAAFREAEQLLLDYASAHGLTETRCVYVPNMHLLARVQLSISQLLASQGALEASLSYCGRVKMVCSVARDPPPSILCGMHIQLARSHRLRLASASEGFGGVSYPAWGGGEACTQQQSEAFQSAVGALQAALEEAGKEGMQDLKAVRDILLEYAALHSLKVLPDPAGERLRTAAHALKLAAAVSAQRKRLRTYVEDQDQGAVGDAPEWAQREVQETAVEAARGRARRSNEGGAGAGGEMAEATSELNFRTLAALYLALTREKRLWLFDDEAYQVRLVRLHAALCESFSAFKEQCCPPQDLLEQLKAPASLAPGSVISQSFSLSDGPQGTHLVYAMALDGHKHPSAEEGGEELQAVIVGRRRVDAREAETLAADWTSLRFSQRYEGMPKGGEAVKVFPKYGAVLLQGAAAVEAQDKAVRALVRTAVEAVEHVVAAREVQPVEGYPELGEKRNLGDEEFLPLLQLMAEDEGLDAVEPAFASALAHAGLLHYTSE